MVEIKDVDLPQSMQRAMARQSEAERERRAKIIHAEGEAQAAERLAEASEIINRSPVAVQLRYFQTLTEIATEKTARLSSPCPWMCCVPSSGPLRLQAEDRAVAPDPRAKVMLGRRVASWMDGPSGPAARRALSVRQRHAGAGCGHLPSPGMRGLLNFGRRRPTYLCATKSALSSPPDQVLTSRTWRNPTSYSINSTQDKEGPQ